MNKLSRYVVIGIAAAIACFLCWYFSNIVAYILIAAVLSIVGKPLVCFFRKLHIGKHKTPSWIAALLTLLCLGLVFSVILLFLVPVAADLLSAVYRIDLAQLAVKLDGPIEDFNYFLIRLIPGFSREITLENLLSGIVSSYIDVKKFELFLASVAGYTIDFFIGFFVVLFILFFFLKEQDMFTNMVASLFSDKQEQSARRALKESNNLLMRYFIGILLEITAVTIMLTSGLFLICRVSFRLSLILAFLSGIMYVIPYIGPICGLLGALLAGILGYYISGTSPYSVELFLALIVLVYFVTFLIDYFAFQPNIYSKSVKAHPLEIFIVILAGGSIAGLTGMLIAIPSYTVIRVFASEFLYNFKIVRKLTVQFRNRERNSQKKINS